MCRAETMQDAELSVSAPMRRFIDYFGDLGPRWGVRVETSRAHALLFLAGQPMERDEIAQGLEISNAKATSALKDLRGWDMARQDDDDRWSHWRRISCSPHSIPAGSGKSRRPWRSFASATKTPSPIRPRRRRSAAASPVC